MDYKDINEERISDLQVLKSAAGWYIGRTYDEEIEAGIFAPVPYNRESGYFSTEEDAQKALRVMVDSHD